jgi:hypothetical protein
MKIAGCEVVKTFMVRADEDADVIEFITNLAKKESRRGRSR